jgi:hypothetical protein
MDNVYLKACFNAPVLPVKSGEKPVFIILPAGFFNKTWVFQAQDSVFTNLQATQCVPIIPLSYFSHLGNT